MSFIETLVILVVAVVVLGPKRLPAAARKLGHWMGVLRRAGDEFKRQLMMMDQTVERSVNHATDELERLVPADEELKAAVQFPELEEALRMPPPVSPDDELAQAPVPGGLMPPAAEPAVAHPAAPEAVEAVPAAPEAAPSAEVEEPPTAPAAAQSAPVVAPVKATEAVPARGVEVRAGVRSLGLSKGAGKEGR